VISLCVFAAEGVVFDSELEPELLIAFDHGHLGCLLPEVFGHWFKLEFFFWVEVEVGIGSEEWDVWLMDADGDEEGFVAVAFVFEPC
jgi:hypothetical protein